MWMRAARIPSRPRTTRRPRAPWHKAGAPWCSREEVGSAAAEVAGILLSIVNVYGAARQQRRQAEMEEFFRRYFGEGGQGAPRGRQPSSVGSGVIVDPTGL